MREFLDNSGRKLIFEDTGKASGFFYEYDEILYKGHTAYQEIALIKTRSFGRALILDEATQLLETVEFQYHEPLAHIPMLSHRDPRRVLIIGGGDGATARELLKHPSVRHLDLVELDGEVVELARDSLIGCGGEAYNDPRLHINIQDGRGFVESAPSRSYDVVIMDMTDPGGASLPLYTVEFFAAVRRLLRDGESLFTMHAESPELWPSAHRLIRASLAAVFPLCRAAFFPVLMYGGLWSFVTSSALTDPFELPKELIQERIRARNLTGLRAVSDNNWGALFTAAAYIASVAEEKTPAFHDGESAFPIKFSN